jgi:hypothetical protein
MSVSVQFINTGSSANAGNGDSLRTAFTKINGNFLALSTATGITSINTATATKVGGIKVGVGLTIGADGTLSATGGNSNSIINILDQAGDPSVDIVSFSGSTSLQRTLMDLFSFNKTLYRGATIDITAQNQGTGTDDIASTYSVIWAGNLATITGMGPIAMRTDGVTGNAEWDLAAGCLGNNVTVKLKNIVGVPAVGHTIDWRAKVSLFRL